MAGRWCWDAIVERAYIVICAADITRLGGVLFADNERARVDLNNTIEDEKRNAHETRDGENER